MIWLPRWVGLFLGPIVSVFGVMMAFFGWWRWDSASTLAARGVTTTAEVLSPREVEEDGARVTYAVVAYEVGAESFRREERLTSELYAGGDTIDVVYDPEHPREHMVAGTQIESGDIQMQMGIGGLAAVGGIVVFFGAGRRRD